MGLVVAGLAELVAVAVGASVEGRNADVVSVASAVGASVAGELTPVGRIDVVS